MLFWYVYSSASISSRNEILVPLPSTELYKESTRLLNVAVLPENPLPYTVSSN